MNRSMLVDQEKRRTNKYKVWAMLIVGLLVLFVVLAIVASYLLQPWLKGKLETAIQEQTKGLYTLQMHDLDASVLTGSITINDLLLKPNPELWLERDQAKDRSQQPPVLANIKAASLRVQGLNYIGLLLGRPLSVSKVYFHRPVAEVTMMRSDTSGSNIPLHQKLHGQLKGLRVGAIEVEDATLSYRSNYKAKTHNYKLEQLNLYVSNIKLDSAAFQDEGRINYAKEITATINKADVLLPSKDYRLKSGVVSIDSKSKEINLKNLKLVPLYKPRQLAERHGKATPWLEIEVPGISIRQMDFRAFSRHSNVTIGSVTFLQPKLNAYLDLKNFKSKNEQPLPHDLISKLNNMISINRLNVKDMYIRYEELSSKAVNTGYLTITNMDATISNISNNKKKMSAEQPAIVKASGNVMGKERVHIDMRMNLLDASGRHTFYLSTDKANPQVLNPILEPTSFLSVKSGILHKGEVRVNLNRTAATGTMRLYYSDFKVELLSKDEDKRQSFGKKLLSKAANAVVVKSENPSGKDESLRVGQIQVKRVKERSMFNYWKECLVSGVLSSVGAEGFSKK